ncbi:DMT family transporter [Caulobacter sp. NIBR2454]|uniref:DMT family transporter n=1 Tax=Caulobacter sp. NIBR2454 TaxID=3015996 RepID=UPI0022B73045|nr:DMT family transporter [Caulobacter sp. NIBR2454]
MTPAPRWTAYAALLFGACAISLTPIFVRLSDAGPAAIGFWRLGLSVPVLAIIAIANRDAASLTRPTLPGVLGGLFLCGDLALWHYSLGFTSVTNATVLGNLAPIYVTIIGWMLFRERPQALFLVGLAGAITGAVVMAMGGGMVSTPGPNPLLGDVLATLGAAWYAGYLLATRAGRARSTASAIMFWSSLSGAAALLVVAMALRESLLPATTNGGWALVGLAATHVIGQGAIAWSLGRLPTAVAAVTVLIQPAFSGAIAWGLFGERLTAQQILGGTVVLASVVLAQWASARRPQAPVVQ